MSQDDQEGAGAAAATAPEQISAGEAAFERWRRRLALWLGVPVGALVAAWDWHDPSQRLAGLMAFAAIFWMGEAIPPAATALVATAGVVLLGVAPAKEAFAAFGSPTLFLFVGSFFVAEAMHVHGLGARMARAMARHARGELSMLIALSSTAFLLSMWMSNAAATAILLPLAVSIADQTGKRRYGAAMVLAVAYGASVGGLGTPVGTPPNLIGIARLREAGESITFLKWMSVGVPIGAVMLGAMWLVLAWRFGVRPGQKMRASEQGARPWSKAERAVTVVFAIAVVGWLVPGVVDAVAETSAAAKWLHGHLTEEVVALVAAALLFLWPIEAAAEGEVAPRTALTWREATRIDWATILLFGGGMVLGDLAGKTGLTERWGRALVEATGAHSTWSLTALVTGVALLLSEATSNTATATLMCPLAVSLAHGAGVPVLPVTLGATIGASFGFMLPISTAPNAMAYGTGRVSIRQMAGAGVFFDVLGYVVIVVGIALLVPG